MNERLRILLSAYACEPNRGSEPGIGWNVARSLAAHHDVWVLTRANNRPVIEREEPMPGLEFVYYDLPAWMRFWKRGARGAQQYYYLWQAGARREAERLHASVGFDTSQHVTLNRYWMPSCAAIDGVPMVWGPVGGGENSPRAFWEGRARFTEHLRRGFRSIGERDPYVRRIARQARVSLATTPESARRMARCCARGVQVMPAVALSDEEVNQLAQLPAPPAGPMRFISVGRMLQWKGFHLGLRAFARAAESKPALAGAEYWLIGDGPQRRHLEREARGLGIGGQVRFFGSIPRGEVLERLADTHALIHPSLHDSGGFVCLEAMAAGRPVLALDLGGPAVLVPDACGIKVPATDPKPAVEYLAEAMYRLAANPVGAAAVGEAGRSHVAQHHRWSVRASDYAHLHRQIAHSTGVMA